MTILEALKRIDTNTVIILDTITCIKYEDGSKLTFIVTCRAHRMYNAGDWFVRFSYNGEITVCRQLD